MVSAIERFYCTLNGRIQIKLQFPALIRNWRLFKNMRKFEAPFSIFFVLSYRESVVIGMQINTYFSKIRGFKGISCLQSVRNTPNVLGSRANSLQRVPFKTPALIRNPALYLWHTPVLIQNRNPVIYE